MREDKRGIEKCVVLWKNAAFLAHTASNNPPRPHKPTYGQP